MTMESLITASLRDIYASPLGADAVFTPMDGQAVSLRVIFSRDVLMQVGEMQAQVYERATTIEALLEDLGQAPARGDVFVVGVERLTVQALNKNDGIEIEAVVK